MANNFLRFNAGTITLDLQNAEDFPLKLIGTFKHDPRSGNFRARACDYGNTALMLRESGFEFIDEVRDYSPLPELAIKEPLTPHKHQQQALEAWSHAGFKGTVSLPTGAGKTILAVLAIARLRRPALILVPTIDLLTQWCSVLEKFFKVPIGMLGGGSHDIQPITVSTYDSAVLQMEFIGNRFAKISTLYRAKNPFLFILHIN